MGIVELNLDLNDEQKAMREATRKFLMEVWRPASIELDKLDPESVIADGSILWDVIKKTYELGYHKMSFLEIIGGLEVDSLTGTIIAEEMGYAASGLTICLGVSSMPFTYAALAQDPEVQAMTAQYCADTEGKMIGCWPITEPDHGSDWLHWEGPQAKDPACAPQVRAILDGDEYVINGQKAAWVSNGTIATHAALFLSLDPSKGMENCGIAVIPLDLPGITRGKPLDKMGQRDLNQGEIFFDNVRIPKSMMICADPGMFNFLMTAQMAGANAGMGSVFAGTAHSAYDEALNYAKERIQGGVPIIEHQNIKLKLVDMFTSVEAARSFSRQVSVYNGTQTKAMQLPALEYSIASKIFCTEASFRVASQAIQIFGGNGLSREYVIEKIFRDARAAMIEDGVNETLALGAAGKL
ncbi:MAG: acyl-CoA/acyl-ACP dehydrogenase [Deltaproteobacteria bacterium]|nr:acyl-CoA/acyl-ACP dehydrogenase [Deltaproteobacteria bacterium]